MESHSLLSCLYWLYTHLYPYVKQSSVAGTNLQLLESHHTRSSYRTDITSKYWQLRAIPKSGNMVDGREYKPSGGLQHYQWENRSGQHLWKTICHCLRKLTSMIPQNLAVLCTQVCTWEKFLSTYIRIFQVALIKTVKAWTWPLPFRTYVNKIRYTHVMEYCSVIKITAE